VLGSGEPSLEEAFRAATLAWPGRVSALIGYDERMAHMIQAGADVLLIPSRFEPCGLTHLCAMRYGTVPVAARVGGLTDTIIDANEMAIASGLGTGILKADWQFTTDARVDREGGRLSDFTLGAIDQLHVDMIADFMHKIRISLRIVKML